MKYLLIVILALFLIGGLMNACGPSETDLFEDQMRRDPSTWSQSDIDRYNGFMDWLEDN